MKVLLFVTLTVITSIPSFSQTPRTTTINAQAERELVSLSQKAVDGVRTANIVVDDRFTGTTSAVVQPNPGKLLHPKVTITGDRAVVTGRIVFKDVSPQWHTKENSSTVTIDFV